MVRKIIHSREMAKFLTATVLLVNLATPFTAAAQTVTTQPTAASTASLQSEIDANNQAIANLNAQIAQYQAEIQQAGENKKTLQAAINSLNLQRKKIQTQIYVTKAQISTTNIQIQQLGDSIASTTQIIASEQEALAADMRLLEQADNQEPLAIILSSGTLDQAWTNANAALQIQEAIQEKMTALRAQEDSLTTSQTASQVKQATLSSQQQTLTKQQQTLTDTEKSKTRLLSETNAQESVYEQLLASAEEQLNSISTFSKNAGGSGILGDQTRCDAWGCYYNQRDAAWGSDPLDGTSYTLASDGCLVTSVAMVLTHYGYHNVTPVTINTNPNNFAPYFPAYLLTTINVDGTTVTRVRAAIDATLATGNPVIVGLHAYGGTHFVVLVSGSKGNYIMRDPYIENGDNILFADHYSLRSVFAVTKVQIS